MNWPPAESPKPSPLPVPEPLPRVRPCLGGEEYPALVAIWRSAVEATHDFLTPEDISHIEQQLPGSYLPAVELTVATIDEKPVAFAGTASGNLEMLFVDNGFRGRGIGSALLDHVVREQGVRSVDVNEQNPGATAFYLAKGFEVVGRSELDEAGRPYPLLHLRRP